MLTLQADNLQVLLSLRYHVNVESQHRIVTIRNAAGNDTYNAHTKENNSLSGVFASVVQGGCSDKVRVVARVDERPLPILVVARGPVCATTELALLGLLAHLEMAIGNLWSKTVNVDVSAFATSERPLLPS